MHERETLEMMTHLLAIVGLTALCGAWVVFQRWMTRMHPEAPGVEGRQGKCGGCGSCSSH